MVVVVVVRVDGTDRSQHGPRSVSHSLYSSQVLVIADCITAQILML